MERASLAVKPIRTERLNEGKNVGIAYVAECNLRVTYLVDSGEQILVARMGNIEFCHPYSRACSPGGNVTGRFWHQIDVYFCVGK